MRIVLLAIVSTASLFASSKSDLELRAKLAAAQAQVTAKAKENSALQDSLKAAATASAQLAAALRDKKALQASLDTLAAKAQAQQEVARTAAQAAGQLAAQAATLAAAKNRAELSKALATAAATTKQQANVATKQRNEAAATTDANAAEAQRVAADAKSAADLAAEKAATVAQGQKKQGDELVKLSTHTDFASYANLITASSGIVIFVVGLWFKNQADVRVAGIAAANAERDHRWLVEAAAQVAADTAKHRTLELAKIDEVKTASKAAEMAANTVNEKIASIGLKVADNTPLKPPEEVIKA